MDKDKSEQLKEVLNKTLSNEDIQEKLKQETKNIKDSNKKIKEETEELTNEEELKIPFIKDKEHDENKESNILLYLVSIVAILLLALTIYLFTDDSFTINSDKKQIISQKQTEDTQIKQIVKDEVEKVLKEEPLIEDENTTNEESNKEEVIKTVVKKEIIEKEIILEKGNFKKFYNSLKYNTLKCYSFKTASSKPDETCINQLKPYLEKNKKAIRFEVIPVMAEDDNQLFKGLKKALDKNDDNYIQKVKEYMFRGLSRERVLEVSWHIKEILGEDIVLTPTNYYVKSKENNKGVIIRAYH